MQDSKIYIAVSPHFRLFRDNQTNINRFLWGSELVYAAFLKEYHDNHLLSHEPVQNIFNDLKLNAWLGSSGNNGKYNLRLNEHCQKIKLNQFYIFRGALLLYCTYFEDYLKSLLSQHGFKEQGSFIQNISDLLIRINSRIDIQVLVNAQLIKIIRNKLVHGDLDPNADYEYFKNKVIENLKNNIEASKSLKTYNSLLNSDNQIDKRINSWINNSINYVFHSAEKNMEKAIINGFNPPYEYFFVLFAFTNYDRLAIELEQSLYRCSLATLDSLNYYVRISPKHIDPKCHALIKTPHINGRIIDFDTGTAIIDCVIKVEGEMFESISDSNGCWSISPNLRPGRYNLIAIREGNSQFISELFYKGEPIYLDLVLSKS